MSQPWGCMQSSSQVCIVRACRHRRRHRRCCCCQCAILRAELHLVAAFLTNTVSIGEKTEQ
ncbi:hypothetical protein PAMP_005917 [Pampus punctatissimus]